MKQLRRAHARRGARGPSAPLVLGVIAGGVLAACSSTRPCREGTVFVTATLGDLAAVAHELEFDVVVDGVAQKPVRLVPSGRSVARSESVELGIPDYASHTDIAVGAVARTAAGIEVGRVAESGAVLKPNCMTLELAFHSSTASGGAGGTGGAVGTGGTASGGASGGGPGPVGASGGQGAGGRTASGGGPPAGTGGAAGGGGRGGAAGAPVAPVTSCRLLPDANGFIAASSNAAKVQGWVYTYDSPGATIRPMPPVVGADGKLCVSGTVAKVTDGDFALHHGVGLGFDVCNPGGGATTLPLGKCTLGTQLTGLTFAITGPDVPPELRLDVADATQPQTPSYAFLFPGTNTVRFAEARPFYTNAAPGVTPANVQSVSVTIPSTGAADLPFDFCLEQIVAINDAGCAASGAGGAGGSAAPNVLHGFDTSAEGFVLSTYNDPNNLGASGSSSAATIAWDATVGNPGNGSLRVEATFSAYSQYVDAIVSLPVTDLRGRLVRVKARLDSGQFGGGLTLHAGSGSTFTYATGPYVSPLPGVWTDLAFDARTADPPFDASMVVQLGVQASSGAPPTAGAVFPAPQKVVFHIDTFAD